MKTAFFTLILCSSIQMFSQDLSTYRWKKRLVLLVSSNFESNEVKSQILHFEKHSSEMADREMHILKIGSKSESLSNFNIENGFEGVLLIGKDGGLKAQYPYIVEPFRLFDLVDSMPMRKVEMRKGGKH